jgi:single-strand DNA-binding protein
MLDQEKAHDQSRYPRWPHRPRSRNPHHPGGTSITSISVVTDRPARKDGKTYKDENGYTAKDSEFHRVTCFNGLGQNVAKYCTKGQLVTVEGRIHYTQWEDQSGTKRYGCEIIADKVDFLTKGRSHRQRGCSRHRRGLNVLPLATRPRWHAPSGPFLLLGGDGGGAGHRAPCRRQRVFRRGRAA